MKNLMVVLVLFSAGFLHAQEIQLIKASDLKRWIDTKSDTVYVLNFWATWCSPCVEELPAFEKLTKKFASKKVKVILVSNDFKKALDTKLKPFVREKKLQSQVVLMTEPNTDEWIRLVNPNWSGTIPATLIVAHKKNKSYFFETPLSYTKLKRLVNKAL
ncbi:MAG: TlpA family protein disulfide reductase [Saprospiraceae bacterium]|nr:TlpA family protein disulfide reductase [Saprospiraceae bacterium]